MRTRNESRNEPQNIENTQLSCACQGTLSTITDVPLNFLKNDKTRYEEILQGMCTSFIDRSEESQLHGHKHTRKASNRTVGEGGHRVLVPSAKGTEDDMLGSKTPHISRARDPQRTLVGFPPAQTEESHFVKTRYTNTKSLHVCNYTGHTTEKTKNAPRHVLQDSDVAILKVRK